jgi:hypothetical protein
MVFSFDFNRHYCRPQLPALDWDDEPMDKLFIPAGTVVKVDGMPFKLAEDTWVRGRSANLNPDGTSGAPPAEIGGVGLNGASCRSPDECAKPATYLTEEEVRRIVREEIAAAKGE